MAKELKSQRVAVTGSAGFIGSYLIRKLVEEKQVPADQIISVDKPENFIARECAEFARDLFIPNKAPQVFLDKLDQLNPDVIFHMGACSSTEETNWDYLKKVNIDYSKSLWDYCTKNNVPFFYASSAATYGDGKLGFDDNPENFNELKPLNLYGKSKLIFDQLVIQEIQSKQAPTRWAGFKFFNVYGPGEKHKGSQASVVQHASKQILETGQVKLFKSHHPDFKDGEQQRDFVYVGDLKEALFYFAENESPNGIYNLGTGKARTFYDLTKAVATALKKDLKVEFIPTPESLREHYQYFTEAKMERLLKATHSSFSPTSLEEGVKKTLGEMGLLT